MLQIRQAIPEDAPHIALLGRVTFTETFSEYFRDTQDLFDYYEQTFAVSKIKASIKNNNNKYWIVFWNELPIGYAKLKVHSTSEFIGSSTVSQLQKIYVLKEFLDKKAGKVLMEELMSSFNTSDQTHIWLSVLHSNERALHFYYKNGFSKVGEHQFSIGKEIFDFFVLSKEKY
ncbi:MULTISPECIES: GNAT family N-acetyltransferase [unclassified Chryseobacterium]|uniref:GNAT family N-acetyltransferase n=1 Tax=unclassified Chryseobacterium TaxID=2593645 RepID=UPI001D8A0C1F|nr:MULTISPECIES: GNAT family N-acetyltransferase [unclassified Chryseobacterium]MCQ9636461.1 GNAT family N-acetyltransferase [Chryseobacterium sp. WG23]CAH0149318.1 Spermidine/spermine N(1)-acetyltransferase [Chryseobacterium sp. Bi04]